MTRPGKWGGEMGRGFCSAIMAFGVAATLAGQAQAEEGHASAVAGAQLGLAPVGVSFRRLSGLVPAARACVDPVDGCEVTDRFGVIYGVHDRVVFSKELKIRAGTRLPLGIRPT